MVVRSDVDKGFAAFLDRARGLRVRVTVGVHSDAPGIDYAGKIERHHSYVRAVADTQLQAIRVAMRLAALQGCREARLDALTSATTEMVASMKALVPVDSGRLRDSIEGRIQRAGNKSGSLARAARKARKAYKATKRRLAKATKGAKRLAKSLTRRRTPRVRRRK